MHSFLVEGVEVDVVPYGGIERVEVRVAEDEDVLGRLAADARALRAPEPMRAMGNGIRGAARS
ncbi:hypothetical protein ABZ342_38350 [Amycolatopsis sp. NPDC005961]|uniref:hypothetical protein n=1 Tax=Amycolatopsis sp. NPDC005961 TaxID=3156720 RepID=UPI0033FF5A6D